MSNAKSTWGGRPVDAAATLPDGSQCDGIDDLRSYLRTQRATDFVNNFNHKLLSYALGRSLQLSDQLLLSQMRDGGQLKPASGDASHRFVPLIEKIVTSPQFLNKRARDP